jgi:hypothetical protein
MPALVCALNSSAAHHPCTSAVASSKSLAEKFAGYLQADDLSSPTLMQQLESSACKCSHDYDFVTV